MVGLLRSLLVGGSRHVVRAEVECAQSIERNDAVKTKVVVADGGNLLAVLIQRDDL